MSGGLRRKVIGYEVNGYARPHLLNSCFKRGLHEADSFASHLPTAKAAGGNSPHGAGFIGGNALKVECLGLSVEKKLTQL